MVHVHNPSQRSILQTCSGVEERHTAIVHLVGISWSETAGYQGVNSTSHSYRGSSRQRGMPGGMSEANQGEIHLRVNDYEVSYNWSHLNDANRSPRPLLRTLQTKNQQRTVK